jgi:single-strand DNA-binding protein
MDKANFGIVGPVSLCETDIGGRALGRGGARSRSRPSASPVSLAKQDIGLPRNRAAAKLATLSVATSERWKTEDGASREKTYWHRITVFAPALIARIEAMVQKGSRVRLIGRIRPGSYDDDKGRTRYVIEFVLGPFAELEVLARAKPKADAEPSEAELPMEVAA